MRLAIFSLFSLALASCAIARPARLSGPPPVGGAPIFLQDLRRAGSVHAKLPGGARCTGQFNTVAAEVEWEGEYGTAQDLELSQVGMLVLVCPRAILRCDFSRAPYGPGWGRCRDGRGRDYALQLL